MRRGGVRRDADSSGCPGANAEGVMRGTFKIGQNGAASTMRAGKRPCRRRLSAEEAPASRPCCEVICGGVRRRGRRRGRQRPGHAGECAVSDGKGGLARLWGGRGPFSSGKNGRAAQGPGQKCPGGNIRRRSGKEKSPWKHGGVRGVRASRAHDGVFFWGGESLRGDRRIRLHGLPEARVFRNTLFSN